MGFKLGQTVYIKTDPKQFENKVVSKTEFYGGTIMYTISCNGSRVDVYGCDLTHERDELRALGVNKQEQE